MSAEGDLHSALMARVETLPGGYAMIWPQKGGDEPDGEHIRVYHLANDNRSVCFTGDQYERKGFLILTLVSPLGEYEAVTKDKAGDIAAHFSRGTLGSITILGHTVKAGKQVNDFWETPIWVEYWNHS